MRSQNCFDVVSHFKQYSLYATVAVALAASPSWLHACIIMFFCYWHSLFFFSRPSQIEKNSEWNKLRMCVHAMWQIQCYRYIGMVELACTFSKLVQATTATTMNGDIGWNKKKTSKNSHCIHNIYFSLCHIVRHYAWFYGWCVACTFSFSFSLYVCDLTNFVNEKKKIECTTAIRWL